jgi:hypothetical protein
MSPSTTIVGAWNSIYLLLLIVIQWELHQLFMLKPGHSQAWSPWGLDQRWYDGHPACPAQCLLLNLNYIHYRSLKACLRPIAARFSPPKSTKTPDTGQRQCSVLLSLYSVPTLFSGSSSLACGWPLLFQKNLPLPLWNFLKTFEPCPHHRKRVWLCVSITKYSIWEVFIGQKWEHNDPGLTYRTCP